MSAILEQMTVSMVMSCGEAMALLQVLIWLKILYLEQVAPRHLRLLFPIITCIFRLIQTLLLLPLCGNRTAQKLERLKWQNLRGVGYSNHHIYAMLMVLFTSLQLIAGS